MAPDAPSKAGIVTTASGQRSIPSSTRADGSQRKEIKIRPGYRPPEDAEVYRTRIGAARVTRGKGAGVPGADVDTDKDGDKEGTAASTKNAKRREARRKARELGVTGDEGKGEGEEKQGQGREAEKRGVDGSDTVADEEVEKEKKAKKLRKKLREAKELQQKKDRGEGLLPEQLQKALRMHELIREMTQMGISVDEEEKKEGDEGHDADQKQ